MWLWCLLGLEEFHPQLGEMFLKASSKGKIGKESLWSSYGAPDWELGRYLRLVRRLILTEVLKFVTLCLVFWLFAVTMADQFELLFRDFQLLTLKIKEFNNLPRRWLIYNVIWFARLTKSRWTVSRSILMGIGQFPISFWKERGPSAIMLKHRGKSYLGRDNL